LVAYGGSRALTPHFNAFADQAAVFENVVTPMGTTFPAHASLFTGKYPKDHRVRWNGDRLDDTFETLAEALARTGRDTAAFVSLDTMLAHGGLGQGFRVRSDLVAPLSQPGVRDGEAINRLAFSWLDRASSRPFFLWLHFYEMHTPYPLTEYSSKRLASWAYEGTLSGGVDLAQLRALGATVPWTATERLALRTIYEGQAIQLDQLFAELLEGLRRRSLLEETIVIVAADHGEALGEHDAKGHGFLLWQEVLQVPLMVRVPNGKPTRVRERVGLVDVAPTVLDLVNAPVDWEGDGRSLVAAFGGGSLPRRVYYAEVRAGGDSAGRDPKEGQQLAAYLGNLKGTWRRGAVSFVDLGSDPLENSWSNPRSAAALRMEALLSRYRCELEGASSSPSAPSDATRALLRALGYLE
jgi:arylsulfatase A-like enzyme